VSAPAGSGKTFLLRSWIGAARLAESTAWVSVQREERNPQRFWVSVLSALRQTAAGSTVVGPLTAAPDLDAWAVVERLLKDLEGLQDQAWLVIDDVHELRSDETLRQLELLLMRAPPELRCVLATRHDMRLGLHRLRLEGEVTEIRAANLRFSLAEARELFAAAGVELPEAARRARRPRRRRARDRTRARPGRARPGAFPVPHLLCPGAARAPRPGLRQARGAGR
jgi:LuxR family maltose regulon positive regulatory protein